VRFTSITIMQSLVDSPRPALHLCSVMLQERLTYRVQMSTLVSESSCAAELIIGLRPDPCSMSAYQLQRCADRTLSTRTTSSIFFTSTKRTCHHCSPSSVYKLHNNEAAPKGCLALAPNRFQRGYFAAMWEDQPRDDRGPGLSVVGTMRSV
jgi:hypothetical protein